MNAAPNNVHTSKPLRLTADQPDRQTDSAFLPIGWYDSPLKRRLPMSATSTLPASPSLSAERQLREIHHWVNGETMGGTSGQFGDVYNPATGRVQAKVALATSAEVDLAVAAAARAFPSWSAQPALRRARVLFRFREIFERRLDEVAALLTSEHGKVFSDAKGEATRGLEVVEFATGIPQLLKGNTPSR
jgi:malonate-semialdehyde dehydrogenase (acetylating) / methylmalonate-semialdehyde dehydrogenase